MAGAPERRWALLVAVPYRTGVPGRASCIRHTSVSTSALCWASAPPTNGLRLLPGQVGLELAGGWRRGWRSGRLAQLGRAGAGRLNRLERQGKVEGCAGVGLALGPHASAVPLDDAPHIGQAHAVALKLAGVMQALKDRKQPVRVLRVEANAVVAHVNHNFVRERRGAANLN